MTSRTHVLKLFVIAGYLLLIVCTVVCLGEPVGAQEEQVPSVSSLVKDGYHMTWSDEFETEKLNDAFWSQQKIRRVNATGSEEAVTISNGVLKINVFTDEGGNKTGFLATDGKVQVQFGFIEARLKFQPTGKAFMGFWLQSPSIGNPIGSPEAAGVETDICEYLLSDMKGVDRSDTYRCALHWDGYGKDHKTRFEYVRAPGASKRLNGEWHTFGVLWTHDSYRFYCDGKETWQVNNPVSKRLQSLRLSCEVYSPTLFSGKKDYEFGSLKDSKTSMECDWVRIWQRQGEKLEVSAPKPEATKP